ncbi:SDR family NAD(P)-dependent oxidoreductase [Furfurilactobacillus siliginis]|uniref:Short chain dehydrogenase reductase family oxidoreductase n=1 Tax=Furfurilactobacillus siliginis TaxID=348151 RepID=A0A0R2L7S3_9LACO|nr:SDR family NAD(P)-dependent oxidoreductase [Furfurilactobacillus siliginis]KRN95436.1 short chain dehydrogenase reductase family oxidoreductase [Furfurilactobacillus siliginis]GEK28207.1 short-chain dehydrogenase/reductase [Furfurilactobacillus siliginis]
MQTAIVTGISSGIGKETAKLLQEHAIQVFGLARKATATTDLAALGVQLIDVDLNDTNQIKKAMTQITAQTSRIDLLVNIAGMSVNGPTETLPLAALTTEYQVNVFGPLQLIQRVLPTMRAQHAGTIINVTSSAAHAIQPFMGAYASSKSALLTLTNSLRIEAAPFGINVVNIEPGAIKTPMLAAPPEYVKRSKDTVYAAAATAYDKNTTAFLNRIAITPQKVAALILKISTLRKPKPTFRIGTPATLMMLMERFLSIKLITRLVIRTTRVK